LQFEENLPRLMPPFTPANKANFAQCAIRSVRYQWTRHVTVTGSSNVGLRFSPITLTSCAK